jgi:hypothetical protein
MSKKLNTLLENEIKRFKTITAYQDKLTLDEGSYRFYNEADEPGTDDTTIDDAPPVDAAVDGTETPVTDVATDGTEGTDGLTDPDMGTENPATDGTEAPMGDEEVTEVDVTDLVNDTNEIKGKISSIESNLTKMDSLMGKLDTIENNLGKMDALIGKMEAMAKQVELMRPPTEEERRKALTKDSYPYSVTIDQYNNNQGVKTQTDLENSPKMNMLDTIMNDYNDGVVKDSFAPPAQNPFKQS